MYSESDFQQVFTQFLASQVYPTLPQLSAQPEYAALCDQQQKITEQLKNTLPEQEYRLVVQLDTLKNNKTCIESDAIALRSSLFTVRPLRLLGVLA